MPHRPTAPEARKPAVGHIERVGASVMSSSWIHSNSAKLRVRAKRPMETTEMTRYAKATTPETAPSARYRMPHTSEIGQIRTAR